jgi:hypothetical protein
MTMQTPLITQDLASLGPDLSTSMLDSQLTSYSTDTHFSFLIPGSVAGGVSESIDHEYGDKNMFSEAICEIIEAFFPLLFRCSQ